MKVLFNKSKQQLTVDDDPPIWAWSQVRNEINKHRPTDGQPDVFYTQNKDGSRGKPSMPRSFPVGKWEIIGVQDTDEPYLKPVKIMTNAHQMLDIWELDENGFYLRPTGQMVDDWGYRIHYFNGSGTSLGCAMVKQVFDINWIADKCRQAIKAGDTITLEVVD